MIISILSFLAVFTAVVLVHELGHYLAARKAGVPVYEFSIGFPFSPRIFTFFHKGETAFTLRLLPLGGFVSFSREDEEEVAFLDVSRRKRAVILAAGAAFNIAFAFLILIPVFTITKDLSLTLAAMASAKTVWSVIAGTFALLFKMITGSGGFDGLMGPVGIAAMAGKAAGAGMLNLIYFTGMLSLSLGIMNLIPFSALDGGQLFMLLIETIKQEPLSLRTYQVVGVLGMALFLVLTVLVTYRDIVKMIA